MSDSLYESSTVREYVRNYQDERFVYPNGFLKEVIDSKPNRKMVINSEMIFSRYLDEIEDLKEKRTLTEAEYRKYRCNPKVMSYDLYGTTELWFLLLQANELYHAAQFDLHTLYVYKQSVMDRIYSILNLEQPYININESDNAALLRE